ncbi:MAG: LpqB family beta-propeller domain-containing protein [Actinomycetaceae bacterium]|nr:LpqB family beta-propeller domain-containing protein [Actinomycetaceae bacterium]MDY6082808.1 LpqB family beta-propeller domain-containing protein [Actinomycetaceae bacterium]
MRMSTIGVLLLVSVLAGCSLPSSGAVHVVDIAGQTSEPIGLTAQPPRQDATPEQIVQDFLVAQRAGFDDEFSVARQYLSSKAAADWDPAAQTRVYPNDQAFSTSLQPDGGVRVTVGSAGSVDKNGVFSESAPDTVMTSDFSLARDADHQWRIVALDDGIFLSVHLFETLYVRTPLYFLNADKSALVGDVRWYPTNSAATFAVRGLLEGASDWLAGAVHTAIPAGTTLQNSVSVQDGEALVNLSSDVLSASADDQRLLHAQIAQTLSAVANIESVEVRASNSTLPADDIPDLPTYPYGTYSLAVLAHGVPATVRQSVVSAALPGSSTSAIAKLSLESLAVSYDGNNPVFAALNDAQTQLYTMSASSPQPRSVLTSDEVIAPSFDQWGFIYSGRTINDGVVSAISRSGSVVPLKVPWLKGATVLGVRVSRDGSRLAVSYTADGTNTFALAGIQRDDQQNPTAISDPFTIANSLTSVKDFAWAGEDSLVVLGSSGASGRESLFMVRQGAPTEELMQPFTGTIGLTAGRGRDSLTLITAENTAYALQGSGFRLLATDVTSVAYPG